MTKYNYYTPFAPQALSIETSVALRASPIEREGLYYLDSDRPIEITTVSDYQKWAEVGWKKPHGTYTASERFGGKMSEETGESLEAFSVFEKTDGSVDSHEAHDLLSELGDVLWCATALASNSSVDINAALKCRLALYKKGIINYVAGSEKITFDDEHPIYPKIEYDVVRMPWRALAKNISKMRQIKLSYVSDLMDERNGFEPLPSCKMRLSDDEPFWDIDDHIAFGVGFASNTIRSLYNQQYCYGEAESEGSIVRNYDEKSVHVGELVANTYLEVAYIAKRCLGMGLEGVVAENMSKINKRVVAGRVDKSDGDRPADLL